MEEYLQASEVIDWQHSKIMERAKQIALGNETQINSKIENRIGS